MVALPSITSIYDSMASFFTPSSLFFFLLCFVITIIITSRFTPKKPTRHEEFRPDNPHRKESLAMSAGRRSKSAESSTTDDKHDVFLSFRGDDTRNNFTGHLLKEFRRTGIQTFFDDKDLKVGDELSPSLFTAIEKSKMFVIVLSENYAFSTWCLDELAKILQCAKCAEQNERAEQNRRVCSIFYKVNPSDVRKQKNKYGKAMVQHEKKYGKEGVKNWRVALSKVANLKGYHYKGDGSESDLIDKIVKKISIELILPKGLYIEKPVVGVEVRVGEVKLLLDILSCSKEPVLIIHGAGGMGKTMLAKALYNSILDQFDYKTFLSNVRETSNRREGLSSLQETLLSNMFDMKYINSTIVDEGGLDLIINKLRGKRVLLVLDDVDCDRQFEELVGKCNYFGVGSIIIVTTRNKNLLSKFEFKETYEMRALDANEALELFCWKAFGSNQPPGEFVDFSKEVVNYAGGFPLVLKVMGSNLAGKKLKACMCKLNEYKRIPHEEIQNILRISYDGLSENQKEIFLDMACFFKGYNLKDIIYTWDVDVDDDDDDDDLHPDIRALADKSLITIEYGHVSHVEMHDLIQNMGKEVIRSVAPKEPWSQSRLWSEKDIVKVLEDDLGTDKIVGIMLQSPKREIQWKGTAFNKMNNLRILIAKDACFSVNHKYLPRSLRRFEYIRCSFTSLPSNLDLKLQESFKKCEHLTVINFLKCSFITEVPNLFGASSLKTLNFSFCENLVRVHNSVGLLRKVEYMNFECCTSLTSLPSTLEMASLLEFNISGCRSFECFPHILRNMNNLREVNASWTCIKELPDSIGNLTRLKYLDLSGSNLVSIPESIGNLTRLEDLDLCEGNLVSIPESIGNLTSLRRLCLGGRNLVSIPEIIGNLTSLRRLRLGGSNLVSIPENIGNLTRLERLNLSGSNLVSIPESLCNLTRLENLNLSRSNLLFILESIDTLTSLRSLLLGGSNLVSIPESIGNLTSLRSLWIKGSNLVSIPESIGNLTSLSSLRLEGSNLVSIPESIGNLTRLENLNLSGSNLVFIPDSLCNLTRLDYLSLSGGNLVSIPESIGNLTSLSRLWLGGSNLVSIPESIGNLTRLENLDLSESNLVSIPESLCNLTSLRRLRLGGSNLVSIPESIGNLTRLENLNLSGSNLVFVPDSLCNLTSLRSLLLGGSNLVSIPESIGNLISLSSLWLGGSNLVSIPESIGNLTSLRSLQLGGSNLVSVPESIGNLTRLENFYLGGSNLVSIPESLCNLTSLRSLQLGGSNLVSIPRSIGNLTRLENLNLSGTNLVFIPESLCNLTSLRSLQLGGSNLVFIPESIGNLTSLKSLQLGGKNLVSISKSIGNLTRLENLDLSGSNLVSIPESICNLTSLRSLWLGGSNLFSIPESIGNLTRLEKLNLSWSNLVSIPESIKELSSLNFLQLIGCKNLTEISGIPSILKMLDVVDRTSLSSRSLNVIWSKATEELGIVDIQMPEPQIPDWFHHRCKGQVLSFWVRKKFPNAAFAFIYRRKNTFGLDTVIKQRLLINKIEVGKMEMDTYRMYGKSGVCMNSLRYLDGVRIFEDPMRYRILEWNYVEIELTPPLNETIDECGIYVYEQETSMEDVRFEYP